MIDNAGAAKGARPAEANTSFDDLVRPKDPKIPRQKRFFIGTNRDDTYSGTAKSDFAYGGGGNDTLKGKGGDDILIGGHGDDRLKGGRGDDRLYGGDGKDTIHTGEGHDTVHAGRGNDKIVVKGSAEVDGGDGHDTVVLKGAESDWFLSKRPGNGTVYVSNVTRDEVIVRNVETVRFSEPTPPKPPIGKGLPLAPNDAGAESIIIGKDSVRILGPDTDFTFTDLTDMRPADGPLIARAGSGVINGQKTTAVPFGFGGAVFSLGSGFNPTGTQDVRAAFANGVKLDSEIVRDTKPPLPPIPPKPPLPPIGKGLPLGKNTIGAERIIIGPASVRIVGPNTDFTFTGLRDQRPVDGPLTASAGSGVINGVKTTAVPLGREGIVFSLGSGFNPTGTQTVSAAFATGDRLDTVIMRNDRPIPIDPPLPRPIEPAPPYEPPVLKPKLPYQPPVSKI